MDRIKKVSFVIPCYRSEHTLPHVVTEIREKMQELTQYTYDIFLVNDDLMRCAVTGGKKLKAYWVEVASPGISDSMRR